MDSASTHRAKDMKTFFAKRRIDHIMIPAEMTAYLQTPDIAINKLFEDHLCMEINDNIENKMEKIRTHCTWCKITGGWCTTRRVQEVHLRRVLNIAFLNVRDWGKQFYGNEFAGNSGWNSEFGDL